MSQNDVAGITAYNLARSPGETRDAKTIYEELTAPARRSKRLNTVAIVGRNIGYTVRIRAPFWKLIVAVEKDEQCWAETLQTLEGLDNVLIAPPAAHLDSFTLEALDQVEFQGLTAAEREAELDGAVDNIQRHKPEIY